MVTTKRMFLEITTIEPIDDELIYKVLHKTFDQSFIKIYAIKQITYKDV